MNEAYNAAGWTFRKSRKPEKHSLELELLPFSSCQGITKDTYGRVKHNLACATLANGKFKQVVMFTIFHFSIFDIDGVCLNKKAILL